ncbi:hypothetical protein RB597_000358 [Gaeumannomyces tritici]
MGPEVAASQVGYKLLRDVPSKEKKKEEGSTRQDARTSRIALCRPRSSTAPSTGTSSMLYELIGVVRPGRPQEVKEIVLTAGQTILRGGGVIRDIANWGVFMLPRSATRSQMRYHEGHYFVLRYDSGVDAQRSLREALRLDPRVIRSSTVKLGDGKLESLSKLGKIRWATAGKDRELM